MWRAKIKNLCSNSFSKIKNATVAFYNICEKLLYTLQPVILLFLTGLFKLFIFYFFFSSIFFSSPFVLRSLPLFSIVRKKEIAWVSLAWAWVDGLGADLGLG